MKLKKLKHKIKEEIKLLKEQNNTIPSSCMDPNAFNYDSSSDIDCIGEEQEGVQTGLLNWDWEWPQGNNEFGDTCCCEYVQEAYLNGIYTPNYATPANNASAFDETCGAYELYITIEGCTDSDANNFNPDANLDDGSCDYIFSTDTSPSTSEVAICYKCDHPRKVISQKFPHDTKKGKNPCPKGWTLNPDPCPPVSPKGTNITCYKCDMDQQTVLSQLFQNVDTKGCPEGWSANQNPCPGADLTAVDISCQDEYWLNNTLNCGNVNQWISTFISIPWATQTNYFCQGCNNDPGLGLFNDSWESYLELSNPCFNGIIEQACDCVCGGSNTQGMPTSPIKERLQKLAGIKKSKK